MADQNIHEANLPPSSPSEYLATPSNDLFSHTRPRSASPASFRSSQSHVTVVEQRQDDPEVEKKPLPTQRTFKIQRKFSFWDWCKGLFNREGLMREIRDAIEVEYTDEADYTMFDHEESPFFKTVKVSPRTNSTQYIAARCLFDTGCYQGNIVSRSLVERLGYSEADFEPLSVREAAGGQTVTGEPVAVDAVIRLSWHHNTSPITYNRMRFLVSSSTTCDLIVGAHSIWKHKLFSELIAGSTPHVQAADEKWKQLRDKRDRLKSEAENCKIKLDNATTDDAKKQYKRKLEKARHLHHVAGMRTDARKLELDNQTKAAADLTKKADDEERDWVKQHPPRQAAASAATPATASTARGASVRQSGPQLMVRSPTASSSTSGQSKKGSSSGASAQPQNTKGSSSSSGVSAQSQNTKGSSSAGKSQAQQKKP